MAVILLAGLTANDFRTVQSPPPGTVRLEPSETGINHAEYIDETVITIANWLQYVHWTWRVYGEQSAEYMNVLPDTVFLQKSLSSRTLSYWRHPSNHTYALVGISYEQALKYCVWRTNRVNEFLEKTGKRYTVYYSLPTEIDFQEAYKQQKNIVLNIGADVQELTAGKDVLQIDQAGALYFQLYREPNDLIGFRCVAKIITE